MLHLIDRRLNGRNKSAVNRERFLRRYKEHIRRAVKDMIAERSIADMDKGGEVNVPAKDMSEPSFRHDQGGELRVQPGHDTGGRVDLELARLLVHLFRIRGGEGEPAGADPIEQRGDRK